MQYTNFPNGAFVFFLYVVWFPLHVCLARTVDGTLNLSVPPSFPLDSAIEIALSDFEADDGGFVCIGAASVQKEYGGGWQLVFQGDNSNFRVTHVNHVGEIIQSNEIVPGGGAFKNFPTFPIQVAVSSVTNQIKDIDAVVSLAWIENGDIWQVRALTSSGAKVFTVGSKQAMIQEGRFQIVVDMEPENRPLDDETPKTPREQGDRPLDDDKTEK